MSELERWLDGVELYFAYREFSHPFQLAKYKAATGPGPIYALRSLMYGELFGKLASAELEAFGFRTAPTPSDGPVRIPVHCFMSPPNLDECNEDKIVSSSWAYERVKVSFRGKFTVEGETAQIPSEIKKKGGRPSTYPASRDALIEMYQCDPHLIKRPAEKLVYFFNEVYLRHVVNYGLPITALTERTLRDHLNRFRKELEETRGIVSSN